MPQGKKTTEVTEQGKFWQGEFGDQYGARNDASPAHVAARLSMWDKILTHMTSGDLASVLEIGPNIGLNIRALQQRLQADFFAVEPNDNARAILIRDHVLLPENLQNAFAGDFSSPGKPVDLAFTVGVLIHIHPDDLLVACRNIYRASGRYIVCCEYFSDKPETIPYRGHGDKLFKRDYGAFWLENFPDLHCLGYGFEWKVMTGLDNMTWWVFEKNREQS